MEKKEKERLMELIKAKKQKQPFYAQGQNDVYLANGEKRKGIKQRKQGGLFDK